MPLAPVAGWLCEVGAALLEPPLLAAVAWAGAGAGGEEALALEETGGAVELEAEAVYRTG
jgi:hypothetical protein